MTRETYRRMTDTMRALTRRLPGGAAALRLPALVCAAVYLLTLLYLMLRRDARLLQVLFAPALCFVAVTVLRALINRKRPYDRFSLPPVGAYRPGKGKSLPSRHAASAAAIALAVIYVLPHPAVAAAMAALALLIAALRVLCGQHYPGDVLAALALSTILSLLVYRP